jgi:hypothetical protein
VEDTEMTSKLYYPIFSKIKYTHRPCYSEDINWEPDLSPDEVLDYKDDIFKAVDMESEHFGRRRDLMKDFRPDHNPMGRNFASKVLSAIPTVEVIKGRMYGVTEVELSKPLTADEIASLKNYITAELSDPLTKGFEKNPIHTRYGELTVSFWLPDRDNYILTQSELNQLTEKLYYPIVPLIRYTDRWDEYDDELGWSDSDQLSPEELVRYKDDIFKAADMEIENGGKWRNLMRDFDPYKNPAGHAIAAKVLTAYPTVEVINGKVYGMTELQLCKPLTTEETASLKDYIFGELNFAFSPGFEFSPIYTQDGEIAITLWIKENHIQTQSEINEMHPRQDIQEFSDGSMQPPSM